MIFMESPVSGAISAYSYMVGRGKPAAVIAIPDRYVDEAVKFVQEIFLLKTHIEDLSEGWKTLWIFKHPHILDVITTLPRVPETSFDHWALGKLFGYEESAIQQFIEKAGD